MCARTKPSTVLDESICLTREAFRFVVIKAALQMQVLEQGCHFLRCVPQNQLFSQFLCGYAYTHTHTHTHTH